MKKMDLHTIFKKVAELEAHKQIIVGQLISQTSFAKKINAPEVTNQTSLDLADELSAIDSKIQEYLSFEVEVDAATAKEISKKSLTY